MFEQAHAGVTTSSDAERCIALLVTAQLAPSRSNQSKRSPGELRQRRLADARKKGRELQSALDAVVGPCSIEIIDCANDAPDRLLDVISRASCVWVTGGNTFYLWHHLRRSGLVAPLRCRLQQGALYV